MTQNLLVEQAKKGHINAIAALMNRLLKSQGMLANVERDGDCLDVLIESDLRSLDDEVRVPKRQILVGMLKKWFLTLEVQTVSRIKISWQQAGSEKPAWTEEVILVSPTPNAPENVLEDNPDNLDNNPGASLNSPPSDRSNKATTATVANPDLDEMFAEISVDVPESSNFQTESLLQLDIPLIGDTGDAENTSIENAIADITDITDIAEDTTQNTSAEAISEVINDDQSQQISPTKSFAWQVLFQTPSFTIQVLQYIVACVLIIIALRGIHAAFGGGKAPKTATAIAEMILR